jgi:hypothetical protein
MGKRALTFIRDGCVERRKIERPHRLGAEHEWITIFCNITSKPWGSAMASNLKTGWEIDLADVILDLWMEKLDPTYYVTVDEVQPKMAELGHDVSSKEGLGRAMAVIAADHEWQIRLVDMEDEGTIQILPIDDDTLSGNQSR